MKSIAIISFIAFAVLLQAQHPVRPAPSAVADLELRIKPGELDKGLPREFSFVFVNISDHIVRMPRPTQCSGGAGTVFLRSAFKPLNPLRVPSGGGGGCGAGHPAQDSRILQWAQSWQSLKPGESLTVKYTRRALFNFQEDAGSYDFWVEYVPPDLTAEDIAQLERAGFDFPRASLVSKRLHFSRPQ